MNQFDSRATNPLRPRRPAQFRQRADPEPFDPSGRSLNRCSRQPSQRFIQYKWGDANPIASYRRIFRSESRRRSPQCRERSLHQGNQTYDQLSGSAVSLSFLPESRSSVPAPRVFISHTDRDETQSRATTALVVELRRVGLEIWIDREHPIETSSKGDAAGPTPDNPLFHHILDALTSCDGLLFVISPKSFEREYVRLEFDPRVLYQKFASSHSAIPLERLPIFLALVEPIAQTSSLWTYLIDGPCAARILNFTGADYTPLILPTVLTTLIKEIAPEHVLPLNPVSEWTARHAVEEEATEAPGCPQGVPATTWLRFENLFGLGPLFPHSLASLTEQELRYGLYRLGDTARLLPPKPNAPPRSLAGMEWRFSQLVSSNVALWTANALLRSKTLRLHTGGDAAVDHNLPNVFRAFSEEKNPDGMMCAALQYGYALLTSPTRSISKETPELLTQCREFFRSKGASPLASLAEVLLSRANVSNLSGEAKAAIEDLGCDPHDENLQRLYHGVLDAAFPGPRLEATDAYRQSVRAIADHARDSASQMAARFGRAGAEQFSEEYWQRVRQCPQCDDWIDAKLEDCPTCAARSS